MEFAAAGFASRGRAHMRAARLTLLQPGNVPKRSIKERCWALTDQNIQARRMHEREAIFGPRGAQSERLDPCFKVGLQSSCSEVAEGALSFSYVHLVTLCLQHRKRDLPIAAFSTRTSAFPSLSRLEISLGPSTILPLTACRAYCFRNGKFKVGRFLSDSTYLSDNWPTRYEYVKQFEQPDILLPNTWILVRIDGRAFTK